MSADAKPYTVAEIYRLRCYDQTVPSHEEPHARWLATIDARDAEIEKIAEARKLVDEQAEDEGIWFKAETAPEAMLQQELRRLHAAVERATGGETGPFAVKP